MSIVNVGSGTPSEARPVSRLGPHGVPMAHYGDFRGKTPDGARSTST